MGSLGISTIIMIPTIRYRNPAVISCTALPGYVGLRINIAETENGIITVTIAMATNVFVNRSLRLSGDLPGFKE
jgi:hypothetical protein